MKNYLCASRLFFGKLFKPTWYFSRCRQQYSSFSSNGYTPTSGNVPGVFASPFLSETYPYLISRSCIVQLNSLLERKSCARLSEPYFWKISRSYVMSTNNSEKQFAPFDARPTTEVINIDQIIFTIHADIRRLKRVRVSDIQLATSVLHETEKENGAFLLSCSGIYVHEISPPERIKLAQIVWEKLKSPNVECFNALLHSYTENNYIDFDPFAILSEMENNEVPPNEETYYYTLLSFCQRGEIKNAAKLLHIMKSKKMSVDERYFNALILGNARATDIKSASEILNVMKTSNLDPSLDTYVTLMQGYIESGDMNEAENVYLNAVRDIHFTTDAFLKLLKCSANQNDMNSFKKILQWMTESSEYQMDAMNTILDLVLMNCPEEGLLLLQKFQKFLRTTGSTFGYFYIKALITSNIPTSKLVNICESMQSNRLSDFAFNIACEVALRSKNFVKVIEIFEEMKKRKLDLRPHYFLPLIINEFEKTGSDGLVGVLNKMKTLNVTPDWDTLYDWVLPRMFSIENDPQIIGKIITQSTGLSYTSGVLGAIIVFLLKQRRISEASIFARKLKCTLKQVSTVTQALLAALTEFDQRENIQQNMKSSVPLLKFIADSVPRDDDTDHIGQFLVKLAESVGNGCPEILDNLIVDVAKENIKISETALDNLEAILGRKCSLEVSSQVILPQNGNRSLQHPKDMDLTALKCHKEELTAKQMNVRGVERKLFLKYCQENDKLNAQKLKETFETDYDGLSLGMKAALLGLYTRNNMVLQAIDVYEELKNSSGLLSIDVYKVLDLGTLMILNNLVDAGIELVLKDCNETPPPVEASSVTRNVVRLLEAISRKVENGDTAREVLEFLISKSIAVPGSPIVGVLVKKRIDSGDIKTAVREFVYYGDKYKITPGVLQLYYSVLDKPNLLEDVFKCCIKIRGVTEAKLTLAFAKADVGDLDGSAKLFMDLGKNLRFIKVIKQCEFLCERKELHKFLNLVKAVKMSGLNYDCTKLYHIGLRSAKMRGDKKYGRDIVEAMQQEDLYIPNDFLQFAKRS